MARAKMEILLQLATFFSERADYLMPILLSIAVLGLALGVAGWFKDNLMRTLVIIPAALVLYGMGFAANPFGKEIFFNLSAELLTALFALIILLIYNVFEGWATVLAIVAGFALLLLIFIDPNNPQANLFVNLSTGLVGAFLIVGLIRREWAFSPANRDRMLWANVRERNKKQTLNLAEMGDYYILVLGGDDDEVASKIKFLTDSNIQILNENPIAQDEETELHYRLINAKITSTVKQQEVVLLSNQEARLRLLAYPDTVKRIYRQLQEVLETSDVKTLEAADPQMNHIEFKAQSPKVIFSDYIEKQVMLLARKWRHGDDEHLQLATDDLLVWAREMQFIKE
jgi:hypothetical protein